MQLPLLSRNQTFLLQIKIHFTRFLCHQIKRALGKRSFCVIVLATILWFSPYFLCTVMPHIMLVYNEIPTPLVLSVNKIAKTMSTTKTATTTTTTTPLSSHVWHEYISSYIYTYKRFCYRDDCELYICDWVFVHFDVQAIDRYDVCEEERRGIFQRPGMMSYMLGVLVCVYVCVSCVCVTPFGRWRSPMIKCFSLSIWSNGSGATNMFAHLYRAQCLGWSLLRSREHYLDIFCRWSWWLFSQVLMYVYNEYGTCFNFMWQIAITVNEFTFLRINGSFSAWKNNFILKHK